jgi:hypothetical protein
MNWIDELLEPLLDRLALKLASKFRAELDGAIDAAMDRADDRIDTALEGLEQRLLAAAAKPIADLKLGPPLLRLGGPILDLQRPYGLEAVANSDPALQQQLQAAAEMVGTTPAEAAKAAGMISEEEGRAQMNAPADAAMAVARDHLRSRLTPPRPWKEIPDR